MHTMPNYFKKLGNFNTLHYFAFKLRPKHNITLAPMPSVDYRSYLPSVEESFNSMLMASSLDLHWTTMNFSWFL